MERRKSRRWPRQLDVRFWIRGEENKMLRAVASNISFTGIFIRTSTVFPSGTRMRVEILYGGRSFITEAVVARAIKTPGHLQRVKPSGMGLRFLSGDELVPELLPGLPAVGSARGTERSDPSPSPPVAQPMQVEESTDSTPMAPMLYAPQTQLPEERCYDIRYESLDRFSVAFERDILTGGLFVPTADPPELDTIVHVRITVDGVAVQPMVLECRVVHQGEPPPGDMDETNLLVGIGVEFADSDRAISLLRSFMS